MSDCFEDGLSGSRLSRSEREYWRNESGGFLIFSLSSHSNNTLGGTLLTCIRSQKLLYPAHASPSAFNARSSR